MKTTTLGFIGLGNMGQPMAHNLLKKGYSVYGYDIVESSRNQFKENGGMACEDIREVCAEAEMVFVSLPSPQIVESVYLGEQGIINYLKKDTLVIDTSTVSPSLNRKLDSICKEQNIRYLGAPVSGGVIGAIKATLTFMIGGEKEYYQDCLPVLEVLGENIFHLGESADSGTVIKLINNLMIGFYTQAVGEALNLGERMGFSAEKMYDILSVSYGQSRIYERNYKEYIAEENYAPGFTTNLLLKDLKLAEEMAAECELSLPIGGHLVDWYTKAVESGYGEQDMSAVYVMLKDLAGKQTQANQQ